VTASPGQHGSSEAPQWRAEPPPGAWERVKAEDAVTNRRALVIGGVVAIAIGLVAIAVPAAASVGTAIFTGIVLLAASGAIVLHALSTHGLPRLVRLAAALVTCIAGISLLTAPLDGTFTLTVILVIWFVAFGVVQMVTGAFAAGATSAVLGVLIAAGLPSSADWAIGLLVGIQFVVYGGLCLARAFEQ
jgi:uncharacterized membrane protein HdeD (DUF308 family)